MGTRKGRSLKYSTSRMDDFQPGSHGRILSNLLAITSRRALDRKELEGYIHAEETLQTRFDEDQQISLADIHMIHRMFLGNVYSWAGHLRDVNISKGGFSFATAYALPQAAKAFERDTLLANTPCHGSTLEEIAGKIARVHAEFLLLHPYREGNGRTARLLATLMAYQAGMPGIDLGFIKRRGIEFDAYIAAVQAGLSREYAPMTAIMLRGLRRALESTGQLDFEDFLRHLGRS